MTCRKSDQHRSPPVLVVVSQGRAFRLSSSRHSGARYFRTKFRCGLSRNVYDRPYLFGTFAGLTLSQRQILPPYFQKLFADWLCAARMGVTHVAR